MAACDYCFDGIMRFCHMSETEQERQLQASLIEDFALEGIFPCDHYAYSDWADWYNHWKDDMLRYYHKNDEV